LICYRFLVDLASILALIFGYILMSRVCFSCRFLCESAGEKTCSGEHTPLPPEKNYQAAGGKSMEPRKTKRFSEINARVMPASRIESATHKTQHPEQK
jgi:hypothetical protein